MSHYKYDRLTAQDSSFLIYEEPNVNMHVASVSIYKAGPLKTAQGGIDFERIKTAIGNILHRIPRYRQKIMWIQQGKTAAWVDDHQFNLDYHVRHTSLPKPGNREQLKTLASRVTETQLDRERPLWEIYVIEGLEGGDQFALINKIHHSMIDGTSGVELSQVLMSPDPDYVPEEPPVYFPRPTPSKWELLRDEYERFVTLPLKAAGDLRKFMNDSKDLYGELKVRVDALKETLSQIGRPSENPLNGPLGPHRIVDWTFMPMQDVKNVRRELNCTVNDLVLATVTGAIRRFFLNRQVRPEDITFKVATPVSVRREHEKGKVAGNRVSSWSVRLPIETADPMQQLKQIHHITHALKESNQALGVEMMMALAEWTPSLLTLGARAGGASNNTIVTNVPGPQFPLYLCGAQMMEIFPCVPLLPNMGIGIALMSYHGKLCWGFNADYGRVSDLASFVKYLRQSFESIAKAAHVELSPAYWGKMAVALPKPNGAGDAAKPKRTRAARATAATDPGKSAAKTASRRRASVRTAKADALADATGAKPELPH